MDLLKERSNKKLIIISSTGVFVGGALIASIFFGIKMTHHNHSDNTLPSNAKVPSAIARSTPLTNNTSPISTSQNNPKESSPVSVSTISGSTSTFVDRGTYGDLTVKTSTGKKTFSLNVTSLIFDAKLGRIVLPDEISSASNLKIISLSGQGVGSSLVVAPSKYPKASAVLLNGSSADGYAWLTGVQQVGSALYLIDDSTKTIYKALPNTLIENAVTDAPYDPSALSSGSQIFYLEGKPTGGQMNTSVSDLPNSNMNPNYVAKMSAQSEISSQNQRDKNYLSASNPIDSTYKVVTVSKVFVNPQN